jgi:hypothetical protein
MSSSDPVVHAGCGGTVVFDLSGGWCALCWAENLEADETEPVPWPAAERDRPGEAGRSIFSSLHENRST